MCYKCDKNVIKKMINQVSGQGAWGITIHKSQGLTLKRAVIELGAKDFAMGLSFVAISQVKSLDGIAFRSNFDVGRLRRTTVTDTKKSLDEDNTR
jgi:ATP-dependent exoDNAse (exonuclease V) alpha subunit